MNDREDNHEIFIAYHRSIGILQWNHSDGRNGSDPVLSLMTEDQAAAVAESKAITLGNFTFLNIQMED